MSETAPGTTVAQISTDAPTARRIIDIVAQVVDSVDTATAAVDRQDGSWSVELYFHTPPDETKIRDLVAIAAGPDAGRALAFGTLADRDWVAASLAGLAPVHAGRFLVHGAHDRSRVAANRIGIEVEAALAFGTGHHGTTRGCLIALDQLLKRRRARRVLDVGTGTGVLAIAAAKTLRRPVMAGDIDPNSVAIARANAALNGVRGLVRVVRSAGVASPRLGRPAKFDLVFANILLAPLRRLAAPAAPLLAPGARVVLSGLLSGQENSVLAAWRAHGLALEQRIILDGWTTLVLRPS